MTANPDDSEPRLDWTARVTEVVIVDIDGTVAHMGKGDPARRSPYDWHRVGEDDPNQPVIDLVNDLRTLGYRIVFLSGRDAECRDATWWWLRQHGAAQPDDELYLRARRDDRPDTVVKRELYERHVLPRSVKWIIDDRRSVVRMWRSLGLTVLQVDEGDF